MQQSQTDNDDTKTTDTVLSSSFASLEFETSNTFTQSKSELKPFLDGLIAKFARLIIDYPFKMSAIILLLVAIVVAVDAVYFELSSINDHAYFILTDINTNRMDALTLATEYIAKSNAVNADVKSQEYDAFTLSLMYKTTNNDQSIFTPQNIEWINYMNQQIVSRNNTLYYRLCLSDINDVNNDNFPDCSQQNARVDPLYDIFNNKSITQDDIDIFLNEILPTKANDISFLSCFGPDFMETNFTRLYRVFYRFGLPYPDIDKFTSSYLNSYDRIDQQEQYWIDYVFPIYQDIQVDEDESYSDVEIVIGGNLVRSLQFDEYAPSGIIYAVGSGISVVLVMSFHLNSLFLAICGIIQICFAFPFAYFIYRFIIGIIYFDAMELLIIFVILGIGADDCFVFVDAFIQSNHLIKSDKNDNKHDILCKRMAYCYKRASKAMLVTTLTTAFAFAATALSPLIPISAFGLWATACVVMNYLLVITFYPCIVSIHYQYLIKYEKWSKICCIYKRKPPPITTDRDMSISLKTFENENNKLLKKKNFDENNHFNSKTPRFIERFFRNKFAPFIIKFKWLILFLFICLIAIAIYYASQIRGLTKEERWFPESHFMQKMTHWPNAFYGGAISVLINERFVFGIKQWLDRSNVKRWDVDDWGKVVFDNTFDLSPIASQLHLLDVCDSLIANYSDQLYDPINNFNCFMYDMINYGENEYNLSFPFVFDMDNITNNKQLFTEFIYDWTHFNDIGKKLLSDGVVGYDGVNNELKYVYIHFLLTEQRYIPSSEKNRVWRIWEDIINNYNKKAISNYPNKSAIGVSNAYQIDTFSYAWGASEDGFVRSAIQGISIAMPLAFLCLVFSTQNWIISIYAILSICGIIVCELAVMVWNGWELGTAESIAVVIMIGFSVDYVVHLGNAYVECSNKSGYNNKNERIIYSLFTMAISVLSGAITTFTSAFWLIFPIFMFYYKFSILVMTTSTFSLLFSLFFFMSLLAICGPNNNTGYIFNICRKRKTKHTSDSV